MRKILEKILKILSKLVLKKYKPVIIAITGSVGKTSTKEAIFHVLKTHFGEHRVRKNIHNYNNEIGAPLTIFGLETGGKSILKWLLRFLKIFYMLIDRINYPDFLILEMGADRPGDIKYLVDFIHPKVGVITAMGDIPVHVEFFKSPEAVAKEKRNLVSCLEKDETAILNYDDKRVKNMSKDLKSKILFFGLNEQADIKATNYSLNENELNFKLEFDGKSVPGKLIDVLGTQHLYSALAATAVGIVFNMNLIEIVEALKQFRPLSGRMRLIKGIKNSLIVDDSYNAALLSMQAALDSLKIFNRRKIVVLGDMLEIGDYSLEAHKLIGKKANEIADVVFCIGARAKFIAKEIKNKPVFEFDTSDQARLAIQDEIKENDVILFKGSQGIRLEKIIKEVMAEPNKAKELLARQDKAWLKK
ncbi:UDP-N-acetylmuramoyl-tripeptide--D-alanyl-D-alanine ligase [Patescibacteria group bacterium]|nr:UDP-N-acetylmuramoyl-tripeptide--D-alanyl-D-alanine ligase [Patescibacteria group bacterium]MBU3922959.1 UDP-N-acetylmuramoyl-tripeptide--D-alanyl-D-alanine ligase [Patescibacteria group bacterium]